MRRPKQHDFKQRGGSSAIPGFCECGLWETHPAHTGGKVLAVSPLELAARDALRILKGLNRHQANHSTGCFCSFMAEIPETVTALTKALEGDISDGGHQAHDTQG